VLEAVLVALLALLQQRAVTVDEEVQMFAVAIVFSQVLLRFLVRLLLSRYVSSPPPLLGLFSLLRATLPPLYVLNCPCRPIEFLLELLGSSLLAQKEVLEAAFHKAENLLDPLQKSRCYLRTHSMSLLLLTD
jgi:hypothetical protein